MDLDDLAAHLAQRQERQWTEAQERMARYRAYLDQVDGLFAQVEAWLQPLRKQGLLALRHPVIRRDCLVRPEPIIGLEVVLGRLSLLFTPPGLRQAGLEPAGSRMAVPPRLILGVTLDPTHPDHWGLPSPLTLVQETNGDWSVNRNASVPRSQIFDEPFLANFIAQCLEAMDARPHPLGGRP